MEPVFNALATVNPIVALVMGMALGSLATLAVVHWKPRSAATSDPLSNLFEGDTLQNQIARVAEHTARFERADRDASAIRAKIFAHNAAKAPNAPRPAPSGRAQPGSVPPHQAERYDHKAVLDHIAKVMRAGSELEKEPHHERAPKDEGQWEEVLLLPAPAQASSQQAA